jgi:pimeloyl-ACP methyl ester carboxylesterase
LGAKVNSKQFLKKIRFMPIEKINGINLYWEMTGETGEPLILVHGSWVDHHSWDPVVNELAKNFRVVTYDRRGHSQSERSPGQGFAREDVDDLAALISHLRLAPAHIIGNSFGAIITLKLAAQNAELFKTTVVHEPPLFTLLEDQPEAAKALQTVKERITAVASLLEQGKDEQGAQQFVETIAFGPGAWQTLPPQLQQTFIFNAATWLDEFKDDDSLKLDLNTLKTFSLPALVSQGEASPPFFPAVIDVIAATLPHAQRKTFKDAGHVPHISHPSEYVETVRAFVLANS